MFLAIVAVDPNLLYNLVPIYSGCNAEIRKVILQNLDDPISQISSEEGIKKMLDFVLDCPKGAKALIIRCVFSLSNSHHELPGFVEMVKNLYETKIDDFRILTPILGYLTKEEVLNLLPEIIKLSKQILKE